jgi:predicted nuclease of predicted toxin-antitoxin system
MRILIDVNLSPAWVDAFTRHGIESVHWTTIGDPRATDEAIMQYARDHSYVVFTHDLDFGALLALTRAQGPSVLQVRTQNVLPTAIAALTIQVLTAHTSVFEAGALVTVDERSARIRVLPIR